MRVAGTDLKLPVPYGRAYDPSNAQLIYPIMHLDHHMRFDLNLLAVFDAIMQERHIGRAGERLGLTQPAVSHALGRLRTLTGDRLFVKHARGVKPTPRASALAETIAPALAALQASLDPAQDFQPRTVTRNIVIGASDYASLTLISAMATDLRREAPLMDLSVRAISRADAAQALRRKDVDLAIGPLSAAPEGVAMTPLFKERFVMIARNNHPALTGPLTVEAFAALPHLLVSPAGDASGMLDPALRERGLSRRVAFTVPHFLVAPFLIETTDLVAVMPERVAMRMRPAARFEIYEMPVHMPPWTVGLALSEETLTDACMVWLVALIRRVAADV
jgi:DNA-binding transcriptional LysR family regulator